MNFLKTNVQGLIALVVALGLFLGLGPVLQNVDPTAGIIDLGALHLLVFGTVKFLLGTFVAWLIISMDWGIFDKYIDSGALADDFKELRPDIKVKVLVFLFVGLLVTFALCVRGS